MNQETRRCFTRLGLNPSTATKADVLAAYEEHMDYVGSRTEADELARRDLAAACNRCLQCLDALGEA